jgi:hypothetical protein
MRSASTMGLSRATTGVVALGIDRASRHPDRINRVAFMETIVHPMTGGRMAGMGARHVPGLPPTRRARGTHLGPQPVRRIRPPHSVKRILTGEELDAYRPLSPRVQTGCRSSSGRARSSSTARPPTSCNESRRTTHGSRPLPRFPSSARLRPGRRHLCVDNQVVGRRHIAATEVEHIARDPWIGLGRACLPEGSVEVQRTDVGASVGKVRPTSGTGWARRRPDAARSGWDSSITSSSSGSSAVRCVPSAARLSTRIEPPSLDAVGQTYEARSA